MRRIKLTVSQAAVILGLSSDLVLASCAIRILECRQHKALFVFVPESRIQPSSYVAVGEFDGAILLDYLLIEKIEEYGDVMMEAPDDTARVERIKGELCTIIRAIQK